jgi:hypothetical protein
MWFGCRFDISEIAAPYARNLLLEGQPQFAALQKDFGKRWQNQNRAVKNLFRGPNQIEDIAGGCSVGVVVVDAGDDVHRSANEMIWFFAASCSCVLCLLRARSS